MKDSWCKPVLAKTGSVVSGGAARNVRIAAAGGMDEIGVLSQYCLFKDFLAFAKKQAKALAQP